MSFFETNDPIQDSNAYDCQQSLAQDLDMGPTVTALHITYQLNGSVFYPPATVPYGDNYSASSSNQTLFQVYYGESNSSSPATSLVTALNPPPPAPVSTFFGTQTPEIDSGSFVCDSITIDGVLCYCPAYYGFDPSTGYHEEYYQNAFGAAFSADVSLYGNTWFKPGTWQCTIALADSYVAGHMYASGSATVAGNEITTFTDTGGFSALSGAFSGTFDFVVPAGGGYFEGIFDTNLTAYTGSGAGRIAISFAFEFLHS